jgi:hypothetical protein
MYPSDIPPGYTEHWRMIISIYPPVDAQTMASALGGGGYYGSPGCTPFPPASREVRLSEGEGRIEIWERAARLLPDPHGEPGKVYMQSTPGK